MKFPWFLPNARNQTLWFSAVVMIAGLLLGWWRPNTILFAYLVETLVIGVVHALKMLTVSAVGRKQKALRLEKPHDHNNHVFMVPFFLVHYNFFIYVQSVFIFLLLGVDDKGVKDSFNVLANFSYMLSQPGALWAVASIAFFNVMQSVTDFFLARKYHETVLSEMFMQPYVRIFVQQVVAISGGFFIIFLHAGLIAAIFLVAVRLAVDLFATAFRYSPEARKILARKLAKGETGPEKVEKQLELLFMN